VVGEAVQRFALFGGIGNQPSLAQHDHRAVVHGMVERRTRQHETIHQRYRYANGGAFVERMQHPAGRRAMNVDLIFVAHVQRRNHERLSFQDKTYVAEKTFVENCVHLLFVVQAALGQPLYLSPVRWVIFFHLIHIFTG
jgi:hypothetical protein